MVPLSKRKTYAYRLCRAGPLVGRLCKRSRIGLSMAVGAGAAMARVAKRAVTMVERCIVTWWSGKGGFGFYWRFCFV